MAEPARIYAGLANAWRLMAWVSPCVGGHQAVPESLDNCEKVWRVCFLLSLLRHIRLGELAQAIEQYEKALTIAKWFGDCASYSVAAQ